MFKRNTSRNATGPALLTCSTASAHSSSKSIGQFGMQLTINTVADGYAFLAFSLSLASICSARSFALSPPLNKYAEIRNAIDDQHGRRRIRLSVFFPESCKYLFSEFLRFPPATEYVWLGN